MKVWIFLILSLISALFLPACLVACNISSAEIEQLLAMTYEEFDQSDTGWRYYAKSDCYHEVGDLIDTYIDQNNSLLSDWQKIAIIWHAGQMYAFNNEYGLAKVRFKQAINPREPADTPILWNDYVYATLAFLNKNMPKLKLYRDKIANGPMINGKKPNLDVVDDFIQYFGQPYSVAYRPR